MKKTAIVTDSTAYIPAETLQSEDITMVPLNVIIGSSVYQEEVDLTATEFYLKLKESEVLPTTSQPPIGLFEETFKELAKTYDEIVVITLSSGISGTFQTARSAATEIEDAKIEVFDTEVSCMVQGFYVLTAAKLANQCHSASEIMEHLINMKESVRAYFMADDLSHLHRGGRLNGAQLLVGSLLKIKPVLHFHEKIIVPFEKVRTERKALAKICSMLDEDIQNGMAPDVTVIHGNRPQKADEIAADLRVRYPEAIVSVSYFGPVIGTHLGEGSLGIGWVDSAFTR